MLNFLSLYLTIFKIWQEVLLNLLIFIILKNILFPFFKIFYTLIVHYVINFVFSIGKQPYRDVINLVSYIHVVYSYNDINFTYLYMRTNYHRHLVNIVNILWRRPVGGGGGG